MAVLTPALQLLVLAALLITTLAVHEFGHWFMAQALRIWAPIVSLGWGQTYFVVCRFAHTQFRITPTLFAGGYTKLILSTASAEAIANEEKALGIKSMPTRDVAPHEFALVLVAGVVMNMLLALMISYALLVADGHPLVAALPEALTACGSRLVDMVHVFTGSGSQPLPASLNSLSDYLTAFCYFNLFAAGFNILPIPGLDGWQLIPEVLEMCGVKISDEHSQAVKRVVVWVLFLFVLVQLFVVIHYVFQKSGVLH